MVGLPKDDIRAAIEKARLMFHKMPQEKRARLGAECGNVLTELKLGIARAESFATDSPEYLITAVALLAQVSIGLGMLEDMEAEK